MVPSRNEYLLHRKITKHKKTMRIILNILYKEKVLTNFC